MKTKESQEEQSSSKKQKKDLTIELFQSAQEGDLDKLKNAIKSASDLKKTKDGRTICMVAAIYGKVKIIEYLHENHKYELGLDKRDKNGKTALMLASRYGQKPMVKKLLDLNSNADIKDKDGKTAFEQIAQDYKDQNDKTEIIQKIKKYFLNKKLLKVAKKGNVKDLIKLIKEGAKITAKDFKHGDTILTFAARNGNIEMVDYLLQEYEEIGLPKLRDNLGNSFFLNAVICGKVDLIDHLLKDHKDKVNIEDKDQWGRTSLILAAAYEQVASTKLLLEYGADVNAKDNNNNNSALDIAGKYSTEKNDDSKKAIRKIKSLLTKNIEKLKKLKPYNKSSNSYFDDSSDEDEINKQNEEYDTRNNRIDFKKLAEKLEVTEKEAKKSYLLHNIGRMIIYSPKIDKKYRKFKDKWLLKDHKIKTSTDINGEEKEEKIDTKDLGIEIKNLEDIIALGRFIRRSQVRVYKGMHYRDYVLLDSHITISSRGSDANKTQGVVRETLVVSNKGLGRSSRFPPATDMVDLGGEGGSYNSAYKHNKRSYASSRVGEFLDATQKAAAKQEESSNLERAIKVIKELKDKIEECYPTVNSDIFVAKRMREVCRSEPLSETPKDNKDISDKIYALTYLLFKTEVYRSPAAIANHVQMLDLIINGEMSLEEAFVQQKMPMSMENAIKAARTLDKTYEEVGTFYNYENPYEYASYKDRGNNKSKLKDLVQKEVFLLDKWLKFRLGEERFEEINDDLDSNLPDIFTEIYDSLQGFGLNIHSKAITRAMQNPVIKAETEVPSSKPQFDQSRQSQLLENTEGMVGLGSGK